MQKLFLVIAIFIAVPLKAQKIYGTVFNSNGDLLPFSSVTIKGTSKGASANEKGRFAISVSPGTYQVICQHIGFTRQEKTVKLEQEDVEISFILTQQKLDLKEVVVSTGDEDPAYAIIRKAIKMRSTYNKQLPAFECDLYTKDIMKLRKLPNRILGKKIEETDKNEMGVDSSGKGIIYLSESVSRIHSQLPDKFKMEVLSSRVSGSSGFGFTFPTFINMYNNNVKVFTERLNPRGFVSPIADGALNFYRYKFLGSFMEDGKEVNSIRVTPRRKYEPLFIGTIFITENDWRIHSFDLALTKENSLEILDTLQISQIHLPLSKEIWQVKNQLLHFNFKQLGIDAIGNFVSVYSNYNIDPKFDEKFFDRIIIKYDTDVNKKPITYWDSIRPVPLEAEEKLDFQTKDSLLELRKTASFGKDILDSLNRKQGKIKPLGLFWGGINRKHYAQGTTVSWGFRPLIPALEYNTAEGLVTNLNTYYNRYFKKLQSDLLIEPHFRYGFSNTHLNAWADISFKTRAASTNEKLKSQQWHLSFGKRVSQFNNASSLDVLNNSINTLFWGNNFMKIYENYFFNPGYSKDFQNGLKFSINGLYEKRMPLDNTTNYTFIKKNAINITPNYPTEKLSTQFTQHQAFLLSLDISFQPGQRYIQFPHSKMSLGSDYPTFSFNYTKGIQGIFGSNVNFDKWLLSVDDSKNLKLAGLLKYKIGMGGFLNNKSVFIQDYQHFEGNRTNYAGEYLNNFQLASYYAYSTNANFYSFAHIEHHLNGLITNKIPLFRKLNWNLVAGSNMVYIDKTNNYADVFLGIENIFKIFRVDFVRAFENGNKTLNNYRIGIGGVIGGGVKANSKSGTVTISL